MRKTIIIILTFACSLLSQAQTRRQMGGVYYAYPTPNVETGKPVSVVGDSNEVDAFASSEGYSPFYISHYGRHGSRWMPSDSRYVWVNQHFEDNSNLTPLGKKVKKLLLRVWDNARGNGGKLSKLGELQHRGIADRMFQRFPQIFASGNRVKARSSVVDRCAKSMLAFTDELRQLQPGLDLDVKTDSADMTWIAYTSPEVKALENRTKITANVSTDRFMHQLFKDISKIDDPMKLMGEIHTIASSMQDVGLNFKRYPKDIEDGLNALFTDEEFRAFYEANNQRMMICNGVYPSNECIPMRSAISLWKHIKEDADRALTASNPSATLRFGHDTSLYRLLSLLGAGYETVSEETGMFESSLDGRGHDRMDVIVPMAANLQMIFYKKNVPDKEHPERNVVVRIVRNETNEAQIKGVTDMFYGEDVLPVCENYFSWEDFKKYMDERIDLAEHVRQLNALNTMVGTAQANTQTAGKFGKGSEEHGQTLPAVLVPNGQNFWTPQTQDTEKKCIAPYYYKDTELQGFRNSHWIVGGCTQDYGSFTVATLGGKLRLQPEERATPFSHEDEISHPHYYAVELKAEHLKTELTALSHVAVLRVTPQQDENVHIVINPNSDEGEGYIEIDTLNHRVYGYNPVHRIYQGWGEPAGFSGHFVLQYPANSKLVDFGVFSKDTKKAEMLSFKGERIGAWLTFTGMSNQKMEFQTASSFTSKESAINNLKEELGYADFDGVMSKAVDLWCERFHTIDVESHDTAKVNQFYGALYRASFLPREMSDVNGDYPQFANGATKHLNSSLLTLDSSLPKAYGDFSMWDIYRAELPLYNIITPTMSGDMMQSLVNMYKEGGWLPIFPCWNSYTAAMIGDHASVALADAYVKGIRNFDAKTAYEGMRKNAFESPMTFEEYKNGMGRRALKSYLKYGYIPMEDSVKEAFHQNEQTSRTLEYAFDDFAVAQMAKALSDSFSVENEREKNVELNRKALLSDYSKLMRRSENWRNVINPKTGWADGRHQNGKWEGNLDLVHRKSYITEGATCHYTWYVPQNIEGLFHTINGNVEKYAKSLETRTSIGQNKKVIARLDKIFDEGLYWHGNEPCHQVAYLYDVAGTPWKTQERVHHILNTEYNDTPGGLSGNDDAGQMSAWYIFSAIGFYPVCPATPYYYIGAPSFEKVTFNLENGEKFEITADGVSNEAFFVQKAMLNGMPLLKGVKRSDAGCMDDQLSHEDLFLGGKLHFVMGPRPVEK